MIATAPSDPPVIVLDNLVKFFGRFAALRGISAAFAPGRLYVVLGDNGAGKSTLLRIVAGLYGIHDEEVSRSAMRMVGLDPDLTRRVGQYSQGMRQRLSLARAVLHNPELILLDEPFSNVDVHSARDMAAVLGRVRDQGKTIFVVTHQAQLMEGVADEFVHMASGLIVSRDKAVKPVTAGVSVSAEPADHPRAGARS